MASFQETTAEVLGEPFPTADEDIERMVQIRGQEAFAEIAGGDRELYERIEEVFHRVYVAQQTTIQPFPGALETLARLRGAGHRLGVATSKARKRLDLEAERTGIGALLDVSVSGDEVAVAEPDPEQVVAAIAGARCRSRPHPLRRRRPQRRARRPRRRRRHRRRQLRLPP